MLPHYASEWSDKEIFSGQKSFLVFRFRRHKEHHMGFIIELLKTTPHFLLFHKNIKQGINLSWGRRSPMCWFACWQTDLGQPENTKSLQSNEVVHVSGKIYPLRLDFLAKKWKPIKHSLHKTVIFSINEEMFQQHHKGSFIASLLLKIQRGNETWNMNQEVQFENCKVAKHGALYQWHLLHSYP